MIRVLQVAESGTGGVPAFITRVCDGLTGDFAFGIACPSNSELVEKQPGEAEIYEIGMSHAINPISDIRAANRIRSVVKTDGYDVVHLNSTKAGIIGVPLKRRLSAKTVFTPHALRSHAYGDGSPRKRIALFIEKRICNAADLVVACSTAEAEEVVRLGLAAPEKVRVVENGIDLEPLSSPSKLLRAEFGIPADALVVGTAGRISPQKDPVTFVRAAELVCGEVPDAHFVMVGSGPLEESTREQISMVGLGGRVHVLGWRDDAIEVLKLFDLFLMTSLYEGGSFAILEAAGARKPIVACDSPGVRELIEDGQTGLLVRQGDAFAIARAVLKLHKDAKMGQRLAAEAFEKIAWPRRLEVMVDAWGALYRSLLDERAPAQVPQSAQEKPA